MSEQSGKPRVLPFTSGTKTGGGSGFQELVEQSRTDPPNLGAEIVGVVSNHAQGGVYQKRQQFKEQGINIPFEFWPGPFTAEGYQELVKRFKTDYVMLSGWLHYVSGLDMTRTVNIHPGPLPDFGGPGMYGHHVHEAVMEAYRQGKITQSAVTMHFVDGEAPYDCSPIIFEFPVMIRPDDTPETLAKRVNEKERAWQSTILNLVVNEQIRLIELEPGKRWLFKLASSYLAGVIPGLRDNYIYTRKKG